MSLRNHRKYLQLHPYRRHTSTPTHFCVQAERDPSGGIWFAPLVYRSDGVDAAIVEICRIFESCFR
jgi:hypothetical protein